MSSEHEIARREFLKYIVASPLLAYGGQSIAFENNGLYPDLDYVLSQSRDLVASPEQAINVFDLEAVAREKLPPAHFGYIATGVTDERTQIANREAFHNIQLRVRRLMGFKNVDMSTEIFGVKWPSPIGLAPAGSQKAFHPQGEIAVAKAARSREHIQILSTSSTSSVEDVNQARGEPVWYQLYTTPHWPTTLSMIKRVESAGCPVLLVTVDTTVEQNRESLATFKQKDQRDCSSCHSANGYIYKLSSKPHMNQFDLEKLKTGSDILNWELIDRIKKSTSMKVVLKGILTAEDALLAVEHGVDGIIVSNHGGRADPTGRGCIDSLPEVVTAVNERIPVFFDSGVRRGDDVFKALALGAKAVFIGRPYLWGLGAFGQEGVERVLDILRAELSLIMQQAGTKSLKNITHSNIV